MTVTNEPGYYADGQFGIRIENVMLVREAKTPNNFGDKGYLGFEHVKMWVTTLIRFCHTSHPSSQVPYQHEACGSIAAECRRKEMVELLACGSFGEDFSTSPERRQGAEVAGEGMLAHLVVKFRL